MISIVVTDGYTLNPGDLSWDSLAKFGRVDVYDRTPQDLVPVRCKEATIIVTNKTPISAEVIDSYNSLKFIAVTATGYNVVDVGYAKSKRILVANVPGYGTDSVAQHTFALILELTNHVGINSGRVAKGDWSKNADWCFTEKPLIELNGKTLGIVGFGNIGQRVADIALAFGMNVIFYNPSVKTDRDGQVSLEEVFSKSDFISLHLPLKNDNREFVNDNLLSRMKPTAYLINTSRGQLINEDALYRALVTNQIAGAALDVLSVEPPVENHQLIGLKNCLITPHNAWLSFEARQRILQNTIQNIDCFLNGRPQNIVSA